jgi:hypothetical protein
LCPKRSIDADSSWESEYNLSNSTIATFNARRPPRRKVDIKWGATCVLRETALTATSNAFVQNAAGALAALHDKAGARRDDIGSMIGQCYLAQSPARSQQNGSALIDTNAALLKRRSLSLAAPPPNEPPRFRPVASKLH